MIGETVSHYKILEKLGEGGMGVVYQAQDIKLDRLVAIKFLPQHLTSDSVEKERFIHEAKAASALNHTNITTIYEIDEFEGQMFIVMEYCEGKTLKETIEKETLSIKKALGIGIQISEGLTAAHKKEIVHRDIKSDNIIVTKEGQVKIMDFGLAKLKGATKLTKSRSTLGTAAYMSPEQASGEEVDSRSDIFSFGVVLYELLTGQLPFQGEHQAAIVYSIVNEEPQPVARFNNKVSAKLEDMVFKALEKEKEERYQHIDDLLADLRRERKSLEYVKTAQIPSEVAAPKPKKRVIPFIIPASIVFVLILIFLILKPFKFQIVPEERAIAKENSLAIMYFENMVDREDTERLGEIVTNLLIADLSESRYVQVVSSQRLYDILKLLGKEGTKVIDKDVASQVARKANAKWMLLGSILQVEPQIILMAQLVEVATGNAIASQRITGDPDEKIFSMVDKLTVEVKKDLSLPAEAQKEEDPQVADVTTHSPEAYRFYLEGVDYFNKYYHTEAEKSFEKALEFDSTFAMAYYWLSTYKVGSEQKEIIAKAVKYSDRVSQKERHYIKSLAAYRSGNYIQSIQELQDLVERYPEDKYAFFLLGLRYSFALRQPQEAIRQFSKVVELDPFYKRAYDNLAYRYNEIGDFEKSIWAINKYISIAPDEANPYDSRADLYAYNGKIDQAIESYRKALEIKPDFYTSLEKLGNMYLFKREYEKAESLYQVMASQPDKYKRAGGRLALVRIPLHQGRFQDALRMLDIGIETDRIELGEGLEVADKIWPQSVINLYQIGDFNKAIAEAEKTIEIREKVDPTEDFINNIKAHIATIYAKSGEFNKVDSVLREIKYNIEQSESPQLENYWVGRAVVAFEKENFDTAVVYLEKIHQSSPIFVFKLYLARSYFGAGRLADAVTMFEQGMRLYDYNRAFWGNFSTLAHYWLGLAYEESGWNDKAVEQYETFLDIWKDADPGISEVEDAKERVKKLRVESKE